MSAPARICAGPDTDCGASRAYTSHVAHLPLIARRTWRPPSRAPLARTPRAQSSHTYPQMLNNVRNSGGVLGPDDGIALVFWHRSCVSHAPGTAAVKGSVDHHDAAARGERLQSVRPKSYLEKCFAGAPTPTSTRTNLAAAGNPCPERRVWTAVAHFLIRATSRFTPSTSTTTQRCWLQGVCRDGFGSAAIASVTHTSCYTTYPPTHSPLPAICHHTCPTSPHGTTRHHTVPYGITLHHTASHGITRHHTTPLSRHTAPYRSHTTLHHITPHHTTLHHTTPHHATPRHTTPHHTTPLSHHRTPHHTAAHRTTPLSHHRTPHATPLVPPAPHHHSTHTTSYNTTTPRHTTPRAHKRTHDRNWLVAAPHTRTTLVAAPNPSLPRSWYQSARSERGEGLGCGHGVCWLRQPGSVAGLDRGTGTDGTESSPAPSSSGGHGHGRVGGDNTGKPRRRCWCWCWCWCWCFSSCSCSC